MIDLDELARLEREATPGPWNAEVGSDDESADWRAVGPRCVPPAGSDGRAEVDGEQGCAQEQQAQRDAALIAAMRNALPELLRIARWHAEHPWDAAVGKQLLDAARAALAAMTERAERAEANYRDLVEELRAEKAAHAAHHSHDNDALTAARAEVERLRGLVRELDGMVRGYHVPYHWPNIEAALKGERK